MSGQRILSKVFLFTKQLKKSSISYQLQNARWTTAVATDKENLLDSAELANAKPFEEIPSFRMLPLIGTVWIYFPIIGLYDIRQQAEAAVDKCRRFGVVMREKFGSMYFVISFNADDLQTFFKHEGPYPYRELFDSLRIYRESRKQWYSTTGLLLLQGKEWRDLRSKTQKHLMKPIAIQAFLNPMQDVARDFVTKICETRDNNKEVPNFLNELYKWALESVALVGLDTRLGCLDKNLSEDSDGMKMINSVQTQFECMNTFEAIGGNLPLWRVFPTPTWRMFAKAGDTFTEIAFRYINRSLEELKRNEQDEKERTLLQSMLTTEGLDVSGAMVTVADMLTAGIDTTSHSVGFFLYNMARNPEKQELLYQEIKNLLPKKEDRITTDIFNKMRYLKACIKESMRLFPIVGGTARTFDHDVVISGYRVPAGTIVAIGLQEIYVNKKYFTNPKAFQPERWFSKDEKFHPFAFVPFGVGVRSCVGRRLAELEIICLITEILRNFKITYHYEDIGMFTRLMNTPDKPLRFNFIER